jgi:acyl carrier protein
VLKRVKELIVQTTHVRLEPAEIPDTANLFDDCGVDSVSVVTLILEIERSFGIHVSDEELNEEVLQTPATLTTLIAQKLAESPEAAASTAGAASASSD